MIYAKIGLRACAVMAAAVLFVFQALGQNAGLLTKEGQRLFPLGSYELPKDDAGLEAMAEAGFNVIRCHSKEDVDRAQAAGLLAIVPLNFAAGATDALKDKVAALAGHPAVALWEGPDEVVWNFTAYSGLHRKLGVHKTSGEWWRQTPEAVAYAEKKAAEIIPNMRAAVEMIRGLDERNRPVWINEALESDARYVRQYLDFVDITGCDIYPVSPKSRRVERMAGATERWKQIGRGKPVYMVLQAFSWHELGDYYDHKEPAYPAFAESRFMAYDVIVHGGSGILYWGSHFLKSDAVRTSIHAVISELAALQPFLVAAEVPSAKLTVIEHEPGPEPNVAMTVRRAGDDWLVILVNEDDEKHMAVVVDGLDELKGRPLHRLYGADSISVAHGELVARLQPKEVSVYATSRTYETECRDGRDYGE